MRARTLIFSIILMTTALLDLETVIKKGHSATNEPRLSVEQLTFYRLVIEETYPELSESGLSQLEQQFLSQFNANPELVISQLQELYISLFGENPEWTVETNQSKISPSQSPTEMVSSPVSVGGHDQFRQISRTNHPDAFKQLNFDSTESQQIRSTLSGNRLTFLGGSSFSSNFSGSTGSSYKERWVLCSGGRMFQQTESNLIVESNSDSGLSGLSASESSGMEGFWDVATSNGIHILWIYSTSASMINDISATGELRRLTYQMPVSPSPVNWVEP